MPVTNDFAIVAEQVSKRYRLGVLDTKSLLTDIRKYYKRNVEGADGMPDEESFIWALKDISFEIKKGDTVGIVGKNGAGKSTLLKLLSRTTVPTRGNIYMQGRITSLLEVGTGFHPELTGYENIFLNGAIMGMSRGQIKARLDEIIAFAGVDKYIDTPVKKYSSGMYVRLAFAVAAHLEPDILVVDEVLAVGDASFQEKAIGKIKSDNQQNGRTVLFVSHNMDALVGLTKHAMLLEEGKLVYSGRTEDVVKQYLSRNTAAKGFYSSEPNPQVPSFTRVEVITSFANHVHRHLDELVVEIDIYTPRIYEGMSVSFQVINDRNVSCLFHYIFDVDKPLLRRAGQHTLRCIMPQCRLYKGKYHLRMHLAESKSRMKFQEIDNICAFEVIMARKPIEWGWQDHVCVYAEDVIWEAL